MRDIPYLKIMHIVIHCANINKVWQLVIINMAPKTTNSGKINEVNTNISESKYHSKPNLSNLSQSL